MALSVKRRDGKTVRLDFGAPNWNRTPMNFRGVKKYWDPLSVKNWKISTLSALNQPCANCGAKSNVEMHHVKHIKTINPKLSSFDKMMARINRKQVPLCRKCHRLVHSGKYAGVSIRNFRFIK